MGEIAGALIGGIGSFIQMGAAQQANQIAYMNLQFQKQQAMKQERLATATRTDAYGNQQYYDKASNTWKIKNTPTQQAILSAQEREQYLNLTEDAMRTRALKRMQFQRSRGAAEDYNTAEAGYKYDQPPSEGAVTDTLLTDTLNNRNANVNVARAALERQALRMGNGASIPAIVAASSQEMNKGLPDAVLQARQAGGQIAQQAQTAHQNKYLPAIQMFAKLMDDVGPSQLNESQLPQQEGAQQQNILAGIMQALQSGASNVGNAYANLSQTAGKVYPDLSGIAKALSGLGGSLFGGGQQQQPAYGSDTGMNFGNIDPFRNSPNSGEI